MAMKVTMPSMHIMRTRSGLPWRLLSTFADKFPNISAGAGTQAAPKTMPQCQDFCTCLSLGMMTRCHDGHWFVARAGGIHLEMYLRLSPAHAGMITQDICGSKPQVSMQVITCDRIDGVLSRPRAQVKYCPCQKLYQSWNNEGDWEREYENFCWFHSLTDVAASKMDQCQSRTPACAGSMYDLENPYSHHLPKIFGRERTDFLGHISRQQRRFFLIDTTYLEPSAGKRRYFFTCLHFRFWH